MLQSLSTDQAQALLAWAGTELGLTQAQIGQALGITPRTVQRRMKLLPGGAIPLPANVVGSMEPGWSETVERVASPEKCSRCRGDLEHGDYCLACRTYQGYEQAIKDARRLDAAKEKKQNKYRFRPKGATDGPRGLKT